MCVCVCVCDELDGLSCATLVSILWAVSMCVRVCVCDELDELDCAALLSIQWAVSTCACVCVCVCVMSWMDLTVQLCCASRGPSARACVCVCIFLCACDELDGLLTSVSEHPADGRQAKQQACYLRF